MLHRCSIRSLAAALGASAVLAPSAAAAPADFQVGSALAATQAARPTAETVQVPGPTVVVEADESAGFDWGSAGVGAGIAAAVALLAGASAGGSVRQRKAVAR